MRYWVQTKAPAGNWVDRTGVDDYATAVKYAKWEDARGEQVRVVERLDLPVWQARATPSTRSQSRELLVQKLAELLDDDARRRTGHSYDYDACWQAAWNELENEVRSMEV